MEKKVEMIKVMAKGKTKKALNNDRKRMKNLMTKKDEINYGFKLLEERWLEEIESQGFVYEHIGSGAKLIHLKNEDPHKAFTISFKTPPKDDTGVAHIMEHSVCCASEKYPFKDTFMELDKSSVNTSLNACTYKDMTMYYGASLHTKDLEHIVDVFMDLVLHPKIYEEPKLFEQEGWHYTLEHMRAPLRYNGIVYNEMKGEYSEASTYYEYEMHKALFPHTCYAYDSGGVPESLTTLTRDAFLDFHRKYYTPSNAILYLYGDMEIMPFLEHLDGAYLKDEKRRDVVAELEREDAFSEAVYRKKQYPVSQDDIATPLIGMSFVVGEAVDGKLRLALQMLEHMLLKSAASPLYKRLIEVEHLGKAMGDSGYDPGKRQPTFSIVVSECEEGVEARFETILREELTALAQQGIPKDLVDAAFHTITFGLYEGDGGGEPKAILYSEDILMSSLYGGDYFTHLRYQEALDEIKEAKDKGFFEALIQKYLLDNKHYVHLLLEPSTTLYKAKEQAVKAHLQTVKKSMAKEAKESLIRRHEDEEDEVDGEVTAVMPRLKKEDIAKPPQHLQYEEKVVEGCKWLWHEEKTRNIIYTHLLFDGEVIPQGDIPYVGLLAHILSYLGTEHYDDQTLENKINKTTGGLNCSVNAYSHCKDTNQYKVYFKISCKCLAPRLEETWDVLEEILLRTRFDAPDKLLDLLQLMQHDYEKSFTSTPEYRAIKRAYTYFSKAAVYEDLVSGLAFYGFMTDLCKHYDKMAETIAAKLKEVYTKLIRRPGMLISTTAEKKHEVQLIQLLQQRLKHLPGEVCKTYTYTLEPTQKSEGFKTSNQVQAIAKGDRLESFNGSMYVASHLINTDYLWDEVRLKGGAYGAELTISRDGNTMFSSYCDPHLVETLEVWQAVGEYLQGLQMSEEEVESYIIGTIGGMDYPSSMEQKSEQVVLKYLCEITDDMLLAEREAVLNTTCETFHEVGKLLEQYLTDTHLCVIGNGKKIKKHKALFESIATIRQSIK